jgi:flagellar basal-body rod protein FlgC
MQALHTAATGMAAQELNVQVISNNIANLRTTGYKKQTAAFQDLIYEHIRRVGAQSSDQGTILPVGNNLYQDTPSSGPPQDGLANAEGYGNITQGSLEQANVDVVSEMSDLIAAQRAYEMNAKVISAADQMLQTTSALFR